MNLNPISYFRSLGAKAVDPTRNQRGSLALATREANVMGPWTGIFGTWEPRHASPWLYEALREALPVLDGAIARLVTLDGIVAVEGDNDKLVAEIEDWMRNVPVNDVECGYQAFYASQGDEHYEQGPGIGEFIYDDKGRDVVGLRVADGKGILFVRDTDRMRIFYRAPGMDTDTRSDGLGTVEALLRGGVRRGPQQVITWAKDSGYVELDPAQLVMAIHKPEADNPYGTSILRSLPFVAQNLLKMQNATGRAWERFGDPPFHIHYSTKNRKIDNAEALRRANIIASDLGKALAQKSTGNSVDLATAAGADDDVKIDVIGAEGEALTIEMPARHMLEQIVAGFGLAPWLLGITWSQQSGIGEQQSVVMLQEAMTRFERRRPGLERPIAAMLRARGRTWKAGDWELVQHLPNLMDEMKRAQADFLRAQTALMLNDRGQVDANALGGGLDNNLRSPRSPGRRKGTKASSDDDVTAEPFAEPDPKLPKIEKRTILAVLAGWFLLRDDVLRLLGLDDTSADSFSFDVAMMAPLLSRGETAILSISRELLVGQTDSWERGLANAAGDLSVSLADDAIASAVGLMRDAQRLHYAERGLSLVRGGVARRYRDAIVGLLASGAFDGMPPLAVADDLRKRFGAGDSNWERLARSEVAWAQSEGKLALMRQQGITLYDYTTAEDALVSQICRSLAAAGPYPVDDPSSPLPLRDSHPNCRCSIVSRA